MEKGLIFNIQKFSIHDGPGIRTTVFLKGCPLACKWCSNPESQYDKIQILYDITKCTQCGTCVQTCSQNAISMRDNGIEIHSDVCRTCLSCVHNCSTHALSYEGEYKSIEEIVSICLQDIDFYEESNGGVTISGGEGMSQPEFLKQLIKELKKHDLHIAIETTGYIKKEVFQEIAPMFDLLLFDIKHYDTNTHYQGTKVHNELILDNLAWAIQQGIDVLPRIPVIPDFNAAIEDANGLADVLINAGAKKVQLLPFHQFGEKNMSYCIVNMLIKQKALHPEDLKEYQHIFLDKGLNCFF